jgi:NAD(P)-dependent dehydrogenase (short-subunit alcohol dehydrogenase family)
MSSVPLTLVTGGSAGIGSAIVTELGKAGHRLAFSYRTNEKAAARLVATLEAGGVEARAYQVDLSAAGSGHALARAVLAAQGPLTNLVNNVGPGAATPFGPGLAALADLKRVIFQRN